MAGISPAVSAAPSGGVTAIMDDRRLRELSLEPPPRLFPVLRHAPAMWPLIVLCVAMSSLYACGQRTLSNEAALWGVKSLNCLTAPSLEAFFDPSVVEKGELLRWQPPLMAWINALCLTCGTRHPALLMIPTLLSTAALIFAAVAVSRQLGDSRLGLWTCLIFVTSPVVLGLAQEPQPHALGLLLALCVVWGMLRHGSRAPALASPSLLLSGIALGLCLLAVGPLALGVLAVLLLHALWLGVWSIFLQPGTERAAATGGMAVVTEGDWKSALPLLSMGTVGLTAFAVGGWWVMMMASRYGASFWESWFSWSIGAAALPTTGDTSLLESVRRMQGAAAPFFYFALLGLWCLVSRARDSETARSRMLLVSWTIVGSLVFAAQDCSGPANTAGYALWQEFLLLPLLLLAAIGVQEVCDRRVPDPLAFLVLVLTVVDVACLAQESLWNPTLPSAAQRVLPVATIIPWTHVPGAIVGTLVSTAALVCVLRIFCYSPAQVKKRVLSALMVAALAGTCMLGILAVQARGPADDELDEVRIGLSKLSGISRCTLVAANPSREDDGTRTAPLRYLLKSLWPTADISQSGSWEAALSPAPERTRGDASNSHLILAWGVRGHSQRPGATGALRAAGPALYYRGLEVATYIQAQ